MKNKIADLALMGVAFHLVFLRDGIQRTAGVMLMKNEKTSAPYFLWNSDKKEKPFQF